MGSLSPRSASGDKNAASTTESVEIFSRWLQLHTDLKFIHLRYLDLSGVLRSRIVTRDYCVDLVKGNNFVRCPPALFDALLNNTLMPDVKLRNSVHLLQPDWASVQRLTGWPSKSLHAAVMCGVVGSDSANLLDYNLCPRRALENVLQRASASFGLSFLVGFEIEFVIMKKSPEGHYRLQSNCLGYCSAAGLRDPTFQYLEECILAIQEAGVDIQGFHCEGGPRGQFELAMGPMQPMKAVDQLAFVHDTIKTIFAAHGYVATMSPKPVAVTDELSNGQHTHISMTPTAGEEMFLAGILKRLPLLCALCLPHEVSYNRMLPFQGGQDVSWGSQDRSRPIRKIKLGHWEIRCIDATANMYLGLAAIFSAGLIGIKNQEPLIWKDLGLDEYLHSPHRVPQKLPLSLEAALACLEGNFDDIEYMMGSTIIRRYLAFKRVELAKLQSLDPEQVHQLHVEIF